MNLKLMSVALEVADCLLPVCCEDVFVLAAKALVYLTYLVTRFANRSESSEVPYFGGEPTFAQGPVYNSAGA